MILTRVSIPCAWRCQFDNTWKGEGPGSCNMTTLDMGLMHYGLDGNVPGSLPRCADRLLKYCDDHGLDRHLLETVRDLAVKFGLKDDAGYNHTLEEIKKHLVEGDLVIVQGNFTPSGHFILVCGFDTQRGTWICNDPAGDHTAPNGYREPGWRSGDHVEYPSDWFRAKAAPDGKVWAHLLKKG